MRFFNVVSFPRKRESRAPDVRPSLDARFRGHDTEVIPSFSTTQATSPRFVSGARGSERVAHQGDLGQIDRRRLYDHHQRPDGRVELLGDVALQLGELHEVAESLLAEVDAVRIDDEFEAARPQPEIQQTDAGKGSNVVIVA